MKSIIIVTIVGLVLAVFAVILIRVIRRVETVDEPVSELPVSNLGWGYTVLSLLLYPLGFASFLITVTILIPLFFIIPPRYLHPLARFFCRFMLLSIGVVVRIRGKERLKRPEPYILMFNHESLFDAFILGTVVYRYVTALGALYQFKLPFWGVLLRRYGIIPIPRKDLPEAIKSIDLARKKLEAGIPVFVSPEGTRTVNGKMREFKKGPFHLALGAKADILPMIMKGAFQIKQKTDWRIRPGVVTVQVGDFIGYEESEGMSVEQLRDHVRDVLRRLAGEIA